ncbi:hypothetical protein [Massilia litorea]|jgi:probable HAF family extracellular repeat protein|uniref:HAF repeat-containing protein n=1 Tax=Massilia litorea TaxID=2769491 RepID=A0A7L9UDR6_9BURK|nr:hypothetical protein [Massilia litorea]QOL52286.1 hypothetical protein LPB04_23520 [Massilia litorea]
MGFNRRSYIYSTSQRGLFGVRTLLFALAAVSAAIASYAPPSFAVGTKCSSSRTCYRLINLAPGLLAANPSINAKGHVSFSMQSLKGATAYFFDGKTVRNIGTLGGNDVLAVDLNDLGQIAGSATTSSGVKRAFVWSATKGMLDISGLPKTAESEAAAINNHGIVTGTSNSHAFRWSADTGMEDLGALTKGAASVSFGRALNDAGMIVGASQTVTNERHSFIWTRTGGMRDIDTLKSSDAIPVAVGDKGQVAGNRRGSGDGGYSPFLWTSTDGMVDLGKDSGTEAVIAAVTPNLHIVGLINLRDGNQRAMSWTRTGGMRRLGTFGGRSSGASHVNANGQIVGYSENKAGDRHAFVWAASTGMLDLNEHINNARPWQVVDSAVAINDSGAIVATSNIGLVLLRPVNK